jgi:hypothetical protein
MSKEVMRRGAKIEYRKQGRQMPVELQLGS